MYFVLTVVKNTKISNSLLKKNPFCILFSGGRRFFHIHGKLEEHAESLQLQRASHSGGHVGVSRQWRLRGLAGLQQD